MNWSQSRNKLLTLALAGLATMATPVLAAQPKHSPPKEIKTQKGNKKIEADHLLVKFKDSVHVDDEDNILSRHGSEKEESFFPGRSGSLYRVRVPPGLEEKILADLKNDSNIEYAEFNEAVPAVGTSNDPMSSSQWHLANISTSLAWDVALSSSPVVVAILDTGVNTSHPDLVGRITPGFNIYDNNTNTTDIQGHGTAAAGSAVVNTNNAVGLASTCWTCRIMPVRIAYLKDGSAYAYYSTITSGMKYAIDNGAKVINISYGGLYNSSAIATTAKYVKDRGGLVFGSAGNDSAYVGSSLTPDIIFVSATNRSNVKTSWSNYGPIINVSAPGDAILTTNKEGTYSSWSGTSFASPLAAGIAAYLWSVKPTLTNVQVQNYLQQGSDDLGSAGKDEQFGYGKINAQKAIRLAMGTTAPVPTPTPTPTPTDWIFCANEYGSCAFTGTRNVRYGANGVYATKSAVIGPIACNNTTFGDPIQGVAKKCEYSAQTVTAPAPSPTPTWRVCANENGYCAFSGTAPVRYGANGVYSTKTFTNGVNCTNAVFGDPIVGVAKKCEYYQ